MSTPNVMTEQHICVLSGVMFLDTIVLRFKLMAVGSYAIARAERDGTRAETRFRLSQKRTSPFKSVGASVQSTAGSRGVRISVSNAGYTMLGGGVRVLATHSIRQFPLHFPSRASPCAIRFRTSSTTITIPAKRVDRRVEEEMLQLVGDVFIKDS